MRKIFFFIALVTGLVSCQKPLNNFNLTSPDGSLSIDLELFDNTLNYRVHSNGTESIGISELEILPDAKVTILDISENENDSVWKPVWGQHSSIRDHYKELRLNIEIDGVGGKLLARAYNDGVAFRFVLEEGEKPKEGMFRCEYNLPEGNTYFFPMGETEPLGPLNFTELNKVLHQKEGKKGKISAPLVSEQNNGQFIALLESDLFSAPGIRPMQLDVTADKDKIESVNVVKLSDKEWKSPWRVILFGQSAGDLVVNTVPINLASPSKLEKTDWIKPGKTLWDWRVHGYTAPDGFVYGINTESYKRFIDFAAAKGIEYFLIDDSWYKEVTKGHFELSDKLDLQKVIDYAAEKDVELMLYYDRRHGEYGDDELFPYYQS